MLEQFDPREGKKLQILSPDGTLTKDSSKFQLLDDKALMEAYVWMIRAREADEWAVSLNRQGRLPTYPPNKGQEANSLGAMMALKKTDWLVPAFREIAGMLYRGIPLNQLYKFWLGNEEGSYFDKQKYHTMPISVPIASQCLYGVGIAHGEQYLKHESLAIVYVGDGGTSQGDFYEAMNFAGVWKTPVIFYVQNNQWAISVPRSMQTASNTIAEKAFACGFPGIQVDGNDIQAVFAATRLAAQRAREGKGPTLIEGDTYRLGAHTTADDPTRYRDEEEVKKWEKLDPVLRIEKYLSVKKLLDEKKILEIKEKEKKFVMNEFETAEKYKLPDLTDTFSYTFAEMPGLLSEQLENKLKGKKELL